MINHLINKIKLDFTSKQLYPGIEISDRCNICTTEEIDTIIFRKDGCLHLTQNSIMCSSFSSNLYSRVYFNRNTLHFVGTLFWYPQVMYSYIYLINECKFMSGYEYSCKKLKFEW